MIRRTVRVGGSVYDVHAVDPPLVRANVIASGAVNHDLCVIEYDNSRALCRIKQTLWHETLHGILRDRQIDLPDEVKELVVDAMAAGLNALMVDNGIEFWEVE